MTPYPYRLHLEQHRLTPIQLDILRRGGGDDIRFGHQVTDFTQRDDGVSVTVEADGAEQIIDASWLIGADGGRSVVRKVLDVEFEGFTWPESCVVVSTPYDLRRNTALPGTATSPIPPNGARCSRLPDDGPPGLWRLAYPVNPEESDDALLTPERVEGALQRLWPKPEPYEVRYKSTYRVHQRVAKSFRIGRVLLAGDAAHLNNPLGGFGLNSGIHDAVNLGDKLGRLWRGEGGPELLDLYSRQRRAATIEQVQAMSIRNKRLMEEADPQAQRQWLREMIAVAGAPERAKAHLLNTSMISGLRRSEQVQ